MNLNDIKPGDPIPAAWLNAIKNAVLREIVGGPGISIKRSGNQVAIELNKNRVLPIPFPALITDSEVLLDGTEPVPNRFKYAWEEVDFDGDGFYQLDPVPRSGTLEEDWAINTWEMGNTVRYGAGVDQESAMFTDHDLKMGPAGGAGNTDAHIYNVVVWMHERTDRNGVVRYYFHAPNAIDGACGEGA